MERRSLVLVCLIHLTVYVWCGVSVWNEVFTDLDFADDVALAYLQ